MDLFVDELIWLGKELKYGGDYVKDRAGVGMTTDLRNALAMKTTHPEDYFDYLNPLRHTGHQLADGASFNQTVVKAKDSSHRDKTDDRHTSTKKERNEEKGSGPRNPKPINQAPWSIRPPESEPAKAHKDIGQTLIDCHQGLNEGSCCGDLYHFWRKCPAAAPVVTSAKLNRKRTVNEVGHQECAPIPKARRIKAPLPAVK